MNPSAASIDTIVQSSTVELMQSYGICVAPRGRVPHSGYDRSHDTVGIIGFEGPRTSGRLTICVPPAVYAGPTTGPTQGTTLAEWTQELANQLMGRIKNRLAQFQIPLRTHIPLVLSGAALEREKRRPTNEIRYTFKALRGDVIVTLDESLTRASLSYSTATLIAREGDVFLFD